MANIVSSLLLIISSLSIAKATFVLDIEGKPLLNARQYYILPQTIGFGGGLTTTQKNEYIPCPFYVTRDNNETSYGMPLTISSPLKIATLPLSTPISIAFEEAITVCIQSMTWRVITDDSSGQLYVATGGRGFDWSFAIEQANKESRNNNINTLNNVYKIRYGESNLGFFKEDGLLGITDEIPLTVMFKRAFDDDVEEIISSS